MSAAVWITNYHHHVFNDDYEIIDNDIYCDVKLEFGSIYQCKRKCDGKRFGVKKIVKSKLFQISQSSQQIPQILMKAIKNEIDVLKKINHKYIVNIHEIYETKKIIYIIIDECIGGQLFNKLKIQKRFHEIECKSIIKMIITALYYMNNQHLMIHSDLNPNHILFTHNNNTYSDIKIINFYTSQFLPYLTSIPIENMITSYTAPEIITNRKNYSHLSDMWSVGVITFVMIFGYQPFHIKNINKYDTNQQIEELCKLIRNGFHNKIKKGYGAWFPNSMSGIISKHGMDFISKLIENNPNKRMNAKKALNHPWIRDVILNTEIDRKQSMEIIYKTEEKEEENKIDIIKDEIVEEIEIKERRPTISRKSNVAENDNNNIDKNKENEDDIFSIERVKIALENNDKNEIVEMFKILIEQNNEYQKKIKILKEDNISLQNVIQTAPSLMDNCSYLKPRGSSHNEYRYQYQRSEQNAMIDIIDEMTVGDMMTPLPTDTPIQTHATPIYGIDL